VLRYALSASLGAFEATEKKYNQLFIHFQDPQVRLREETVEFSANGVGAQGLSRYAFALHLHSSIDAEVCLSIFVRPVFISD